MTVGLALTLGPALAPATIEEQRQRLPPPAEACGDDPIAGVWQAHVYYAHVGQWYMTRIEIERDRGDPSGERLVGSIYSEFWDGGPSDSQPPACDGPGERAAVNERAAGRATGLQLQVDALDWADAQVCGPTSFGYLLDHFSGTVDVERMEISIAAQRRRARVAGRAYRVSPGEVQPRAPGARTQDRRRAAALRAGGARRLWAALELGIAAMPNTANVQGTSAKRSRPL